MDIELLEGVENVLSTARSVRKKLDFSRPVSQEDLEACIDVAVQAPTGIDAENWRFLVVTEPAIKQKIADIYCEVMMEIGRSGGVTLKPTHNALMARLHEMPCMVFVFAIGEPSNDIGGQVGFFGSILPAGWSLMLAMRARGIGTTWTSLLTSRHDEIAEILGVPAGVTQTVMLPAAYTLGARLKKADRLPAAKVTFWEQWGE